MIMHPGIRAALASQRVADEKRAAERFRLRRHVRRAAHRETPLEPIVIRHATERDRRLIEQIAALESKPVPTGRPLVAIKGGRLEAVLDHETGEVLADPFLPSAQAARLVRAYAHIRSERAA